MKKYTQYIFWISVLFLFTKAPLVAHANDCGSGTGLTNHLGICSFSEFVNKLLDGVILIGTPIAGLFIVYSGFLFVTAQGSEDKIKTAKQMFYYTIIGVAILLGSKAIALLVEGTFKQLGV